MDSNRQHAFIGNSEDCSVPLHYNKERVDMVMHSEIYPKTVPMRQSQCMCFSVAENSVCNFCRNNTSNNNNNWKNHHNLNKDCGNNSNSSLPETPMYIQLPQTGLNNKRNNFPLDKSNWYPYKTAYLDDLMTNTKVTQTHAEKIKPPDSQINGNFDVENSVRYKQHQQHYPADSYCKDRWSCDEKNSLKKDSYRYSKIGYAPLDNTNGLGPNIRDHNLLKMETSHTISVDQHVVNPSNIMAMKDQQPSPNYARKCPQIFNSAEHNSCHNNLYVSPPQFSSEKFANASSQRKITGESSQQKYRLTTSQSVNSHPENHGSLLLSKMSTPIMTLLPSQSIYPPSQGLQNPRYLMTSNNNTNFYTPPPSSTIDTPEMSPVTVRSHHQYSERPLPSSNLMDRKNIQSSPDDCVKMEDEIFDLHGTSNRNLYINPYNPAKSDDCCTEQFGTKSTICSGSNQSYLKTSRTIWNKRKNEFDNTLQQSHTSVYSNTSYYYENQARRYEGSIQKLSSPALAATASSPFPATSQPSTQGHIMHLPHPHRTQNMEDYQLVPPPDFDTQTMKKQDFSCAPSVDSGGMKVLDNHLPRVRNNSQKLQQNLNAHPSPPVHTPQSTKRSQATKPNYRELINHVYAMRNSTSEEELNLKIIKKALNVDAQIMRSHVAPVPVPVKTLNEKLHYNTSIQYPKETCMRASVFSAMSSNYSHKSNLINELPTSQPAHSNMGNILHKKKEKPISTSPLDLSMRTIKTKADSTEYSQKKGRAISSINLQSQSTKYALPRVDFTPNFCLHSNDRDPNAVRSDYANIEKKELNSHLTMKHYDSTNQVNEPSLPQYEAAAMHTTIVHREPPQRQVEICQTQNMISSSPPILVPASTEDNIKLLSKSIDTVQTRPSVLETNPYAQGRLQISSPQNDFHLNKISVVNKLPPDTSIMPLTKFKHAEANAASNNVINSPQQPSAYRLACERNPNFLGRKRHLHEYTTNAKFNEPSLKKPRFKESANIKEETPRKCEHKVMTFAEQLKITTDKSVRAEDSHTDVSNAEPLLCKQETNMLTNESVIQPTVTAKSETTSLIAARIRTKAELKGFIFNDIMESSVKELKIKEEPRILSDSTETPSMPVICGDLSQNYLLDWNWANTCNGFVEQLLNSSKKQTIRKKSPCVPKLDSNNYDAPTTSMVTLKSDALAASDEFQCVQEDSYDCSMSKKTVLKSTNPGIEVSDNVKNCKTGLQEEINNMSTVVQKKFSKSEREKIRQQQEKRLAARLQKESSSESENEVTKRLSERLKKPLKRGKLRGAVAERKHFSDCGSDSSTDGGNQDGSAKKSTKRHISVQCTGKQNDGSDEGKCSEKESNKLPTKISNDKKGERWNAKIKNNQKTSPNGVGSTDSKREQSDTEVINETSCCQQQEGKEEYSSNNVQFTSRKNNVSCKQIKKSNLNSKIQLNTITRSKRKRELELQIANSKVLRNDKIIRNSTTKIKRKYVRKFGNNAIQTAISADKEPLMTTRLRSKNDRQLSQKQNSLTETKRPYNKKKSESSASKDQQADMFLEVYRYKRALKIPASLISIKHPNSQRISSSLPDLEEGIKTKSLSMHKSKISKTQIAAKEKVAPNLAAGLDEPKSIIDVLHSRVIKSNIRSKVKITRTNAGNNAVQTHSEISQTTESNSIGLGELLPTPKKEAVEVVNDGKRRHFSIFDTKVLQSKTRTESKLQQRKEIIREIFVGDDRPASAPPEISQSTDGCEKMTYEQKYEQFLQQMNIVVNEEKLRKFGKTTTSVSSSVKNRNFQLDCNIKPDNDTDCTNAFYGGEKLDCDQQENILIASETTNCFRRRRPTKYLRRKGSSGFDYIRKKKKPTPILGSNHNLSSKAERPCEVIEKAKTENDVCREIQKWVLNKGVGQSTMHKAARLGYIDVVVYCLDRMGLNPDQKDNAGYTPLHEACTNGWLEIARVLLQYGANHSEAAHSGIRPLHEASENNNLEIVRLLLSYGADPLLATYSGQTPFMLASSNSMKELINQHLKDIQILGIKKKPWRFNGPWDIFDESVCGYDIFEGAASTLCDISRAIRFSSKKKLNKRDIEISSHIASNSCGNIENLNCIHYVDGINTISSRTAFPALDQAELIKANSDSDEEMFEFEEADVLLPPLYLLKDEGMDKWVLLSDLCNLLKVKSKDTLLNKIYPSSSISTANRSLIRELKMSDFLEKATCLQLLSAGEKINICASKVVLIKYNDNVRNLLGVKAVLMKF